MAFCFAYHTDGEEHELCVKESADRGKKIKSILLTHIIYNQMLATPSDVWLSLLLNLQELLRSLWEANIFSLKILTSCSTPLSII